MILALCMLEEYLNLGTVMRRRLIPRTRRKLLSLLTIPLPRIIFTANIMLVNVMIRHKDEKRFICFVDESYKFSLNKNQAIRRSQSQKKLPSNPIDPVFYNAPVWINFIDCTGLNNVGLRVPVHALRWEENLGKEPDLAIIFVSPFEKFNIIAAKFSPDDRTFLRVFCLLDMVLVELSVARELDYDQFSIEAYTLGLRMGWKHFCLEVWIEPLDTCDCTEDQEKYWECNRFAVDENEVSK
ncbi:hypothetical protein G9A89_023467 [Geosiphon pyriformis]|nr:hypothetical protein G9A89_023467 [Geosiphon pyriformis]